MCNHGHIWFHLTQTLFLPHCSINQATHCLLQWLQQMPLPSHQEYIFEVHLLTDSTSCAGCMHMREQPQATTASSILRKRCPPRANYRHHILDSTALVPTPPLPSSVCHPLLRDSCAYQHTEKHPSFHSDDDLYLLSCHGGCPGDVGSACLWPAYLFSKMCFKHGLG